MMGGLNFMSLQVSGKKTEDRAGMGENITAWTMCLQRFRQSIPANTARLFRELISSRKPENLYGPFFEYMEAQDDFFKRVTCDSRFDYIRERMQNRVQSKLRNLILSKVWTRACATFFKLLITVLSCFIASGLPMVVRFQWKK